MMAIEGETEGDHLTRDYFWISKTGMKDLIKFLLEKTHLDTWLWV